MMIVPHIPTRISVGYAHVSQCATLRGTPKQVQWGKDIRSKKLCQIDAMRSTFALMPDIEYRLSWLRWIPDASWWIVRKDKTPVALIRDLTLSPIRTKRYPLNAPYEVLSWASCLYNTVIIDTETTGLHDGAEIVEIAAIDLQGNILLNTLIRPSCSIPEGATAIHGITDAMVATSPTFHQVWPMLYALLSRYRVVIYNAQYDTRIIRNMSKNELIPYPTNIYPDCAMMAYAAYKQEWNEWRDGYRWHKLEKAASEMHVPTPNAHRALGDCLSTLGVINRLQELHEQETFERDFERYPDSL